ncbi:NAD(P)H-dependent oxidoreductase [Flammeovirga sp. SubArs3]|uniref:NAD(P)H-dependent oxidoreductase n=1 Tax=Flammeovirga sp. SubArs3 TaxID=2995316 RepID=UPI00248C482C|nr:NAD(P)H-dependent oxidoreductase [Flammeovirga sp. SubArs3]
MKTLMILAHPRLEKSVANKRIADEIKNKIDDVEVRDIFSLYPDYKIDVEAEQQALINADTIIFQYPFWWYNMPAILKAWFDEVFDFNFAYGPEGNKLKGKNFQLSFTVGGPTEAYTPTGYNHFRIEELTKPMEQTAYMAQMNFLKPIYEHGMVYVPNVYNTQEAVEARADQQLERIISVIDGFKNETPEVKITAFVKNWFAHFDQLAEDGYFTHSLEKDAQLVFPEGEFIGHQGFSEWYSAIKKEIKPDNQHIIESISITPNNEYFNVDLAVKLKAEKYSGEALQLNVKEKWKVEITKEGNVKIHTYKVKAV